MKNNTKLLYLFGFLLLSQNHFQCTPLLADVDKINAIATIEEDSVYTDKMLQDYGVRLYSTNIARFIIIDTLTNKVTPYEFVEKLPQK
jgi:hypothetical protein